jgi:hypothetical protein
LLMAACMPAVRSMDDSRSSPHSQPAQRRRGHFFHEWRRQKNPSLRWQNPSQKDPPASFPTSKRPTANGYTYLARLLAGRPTVAAAAPAPPPSSIWLPVRGLAMRETPAMSASMRTINLHDSLAQEDRRASSLAPREERERARAAALAAAGGADGDPLLSLRFAAPEGLGIYFVWAPPEDAGGRRRGSGEVRSSDGPSSIVACCWLEFA